MAKLPKPPFPLLEYVEGEIKYEGESGPKCLSKEALKRRIERALRPARTDDATGREPT